MRLLLDTNTALWSVSSSHRLPQAIADLIADQDNDVSVSIVTLWEIAIKNAPGRKRRMPMSAKVANARFFEMGFQSLNLSAAHAIATEALPLHHRDPFDRMLVAQAMVEPMRLVTADRTLSAYSDTIIVF